MPRLSFKSVNSALAAIISIVLLVGVSILVIYVGKSSYNIVNETSVDGMKIINRGLITNVNDLIDANMSMIKVPAQSGQAKKAIEGDSAEMDELIKALIKEYKGINSLFVLNGQGKAISGASSTGESFIGNDYGDRATLKLPCRAKTPSTPILLLQKQQKEKFSPLAPLFWATTASPLVWFVLPSTDLNI